MQVTRQWQGQQNSSSKWKVDKHRCTHLWAGEAMRRCSTASRHAYKVNASSTVPLSCNYLLHRATGIADQVQGQSLCLLLEVISPTHPLLLAAVTSRCPWTTHRSLLVDGYDCSNWCSLLTKNGTLNLRVTISSMYTLDLSKLNTCTGTST